MKDALSRLDAEIATQESLLAGLRKARSILSEAPEDAASRKPRPEVLLLEGPRRRNKRRKLGEGSEIVYEINDVNVEVSSVQFDLLQALFKVAPECVPVKQLAEIAGSAFKVKKQMALLSDLVKPAKARIESERGSGYRICTDD